MTTQIWPLCTVVRLREDLLGGECRVESSSSDLKQQNRKEATFANRSNPCMRWLSPKSRSAQGVLGFHVKSDNSVIILRWSFKSTRTLFCRCNQGDLESEPYSIHKLGVCTIFLIHLWGLQISGRLGRQPRNCSLRIIVCHSRMEGSPPFADSHGLALT